MSERRRAYRPRRVRLPDEPVVKLTRAHVLDFWLPGEFTQLNQYIRAERGNKFEAAGIKQAETLRTMAEVQDLPAVALYPVSVTFTWHRTDRRTDPDNIAFAAKYILDGLVKAGVLKDDGMDEIAELHHHFTIDKSTAGVAVLIQPVKGV
jgi:Holliday junction resolvase RusA-like endonuclease